MTLGSTITTKSNDKTDARFSSSSLASTASTNSDSKKRDVKRRPRKRGGSDDEYADNRDLLVIENFLNFYLFISHDELIWPVLFSLLFEENLKPTSTFNV